MSTYVLIHGAWHGGWSWRWVQEILEQHNHRVFTPTMLGLGEREDFRSATITMDALVNDIVQFIYQQDIEEIILVGHSFGGAVISGVAEYIPDRIKQLIYLDAAILESDECMFDCMHEAVISARKRSAKKYNNNLFMPVPTAADLGITDDNQWNLIANLLSPQPLSTYSTPLTLKNAPGDGFNCCYIVCTDPIYEPLVWARDRVKQYGWPVIPIKTGHEAMICEANKLSEMLMQADLGKKP